MRDLIKEIDVRKVIVMLNLEITDVSGDNLMIKCPFHDDKISSFGVSYKGERKGLYNCFACGEKGNIITLITKLLDCTRAEAIDKTIGNQKEDEIKYILKRLTDIEVVTPQEKRKGAKYTELELYPLYQEIMPYQLLDRLKIETVIRYRLSLVSNMQEVFNLSESNEYSNRIAIPVFIDGELKNIQFWDYMHKSNRKYLNLPYSNAIDLVFGYDLMTSDDVIVVEGPFDAMKLNEYGYNSVAILGSSFSFKKAYLLLQKPVRSLILCFDGDSAGYRAMKDSIKKLRDIFSISAIYLGEKDPADLTKKEFDDLFETRIEIK